MIGSQNILMAAASNNIDTAWTLKTVTLPAYDAFSVYAQETSPTGLFLHPEGTKMYVVGAGGDAVYEYSLGTPWDIYTATFVQSFSVAAEETFPRGIFFSPVGTKMYVCGSVNEQVREYTLTVPWDISTASYTQGFSVAAQLTTPAGIFFKPDGTKMYVADLSPNDINEYSLSTAWDVSTASYVQNFSVNAQQGDPNGVFFRADGAKMYVVGVTPSNVAEYSLSTPWDISTASYVASSLTFEGFSTNELFFGPDGTNMYVVSFSGNILTATLGTAWDVSTASWTAPDFLYVGTQDVLPNGVFFKPDGTKVYVVGANGDAVYEYDLSTAWDLTTASYLQNFSVASQDTGPIGMFFKPDGTKIYVCGSVGDDINEYSLTTAWDISTASYVQNFSVLDTQPNPSGVYFSPDGLYMFVVANTQSAAFRYTLGTAWDVSTATIPPYSSFSVSAQETFPRSLFLKPDGTKMYVIGTIGDDVNEYDLSTAWDVTTATFVQNFSISAQEGFPTGIFFKDDGAKMYVVGVIGDNINEYSLTTAWDISTASYVQNFSVSAQDGTPQNVKFKADGTKMYIVGNDGDAVYEYSLSTAWDVSTASYVQNLSVAAQDTNPLGLAFKPDGTKMYVAGIIGQAVYEYDLSTAWDISTASYVRSFSVAPQGNAPSGVFFSSDGTEMYVVDSSSIQVSQYTLGTAWDISTAAWEPPADSWLALSDLPQDIFFKPDGTKMYIVGDNGDAVYEYGLPTAWDISTAAYLRNYTVADQERSPTGISFKDDGTEMYVCGTSTDAVWKYDLV